MSNVDKLLMKAFQVAGTSREGDAQDGRRSVATESHPEQLVALPREASVAGDALRADPTLVVGTGQELPTFPAPDKRHWVENGAVESGVLASSAALQGSLEFPTFFSFATTVAGPMSVTAAAVPVRPLPSAVTEPAPVTEPTPVTRPSLATVLSPATEAAQSEPVPEASNQPHLEVFYPDDVRDEVDAVGHESNPAWEVDRLTWPPVVSDLLQVAQGPIKRFVHWLEESMALASVGPRCALAVTSCQRGEGRSTVACVLARQAALAGLRVALVDGDRDSPKLASWLGLLAQRGWDAHPDQPDLVSIHSIEDFLTIVPLAAEPEPNVIWNPYELIVQLRQSYDLVVMDAPPLSELQPAWRDAGQAGLSWLVVRDPRVTNELEMTRAHMRIRAEGLAMLGIAENFAA